MTKGNLKVVESEAIKEEKIVDYIKSLSALEEEMEPYKDQKRALKQNYIENGWLSKEEISSAVKAFRLMKSEVDLEQMKDFFELYSKTKVCG
ncbi:MAG: hypothetical protein JRJ77_18115 [Deltaproteobacteria bacterium]|jgi:hypothetical protein|nr:hypothetical protein [Deltaproteobacteria bacterium]